MSESNEKISDLETRVSSAQDHIEKHKSDLSSLYTKSDKSETALKQQGNDIVTHHLKITSNESGIAQAAQDITKHKEALTKTQEELNAMKNTFAKFLTTGSVSLAVLLGLIVFMFIGYFSQSSTLSEVLEKNATLLKTIEETQAKSSTEIKTQITTAHTIINGIEKSVKANAKLVKRNAKSLGRVIRKSGEIKTLVLEGQEGER